MTREEIEEKYYLKELSETGDTWTALLKESLGKLPGKRILELGTGSGFVAVLLAQMGYRVTAVDENADAVGRVREAAELLGLSQRLRAVCADACSLPFGDGSFDAVVCRYASFLFVKPLRFYQEAGRVLAPGGVLLNFDMNWLSPLWDEETAIRFQADEAEVLEKYPDFQDMYGDMDAMFRLSQLPLAGKRRPQWDKELLENLDFSEFSVSIPDQAGLWKPKRAIRYRSLPTFLIKAVK